MSFIDRAYYDVAIIEMDEAVKLSNFVYPICIPEISRNVDYRVNTGASMAGWGATEKSNGQPVITLKETKMTVFSQSYCDNKWDITSTAFPPGASSVLEEIPELFQSNLLCAGTVSSIFSTLAFTILALIIYF